MNKKHGFSLFILFFHGVFDGAEMFFTQKPSLFKNGEKADINFCMPVKANVEVAILHSKGQAVRHFFDQERMDT